MLGKLGTWKIQRFKQTVHADSTSPRPTVLQCQDTTTAERAKRGRFKDVMTLDPRVFLECREKTLNYNEDD